MKDVDYHVHEKEILAANLIFFNRLAVNLIGDYGRAVEALE